jgi:surfeit locus 1 family protein
MAFPLLRKARLRFHPPWWALALALAGAIGGLLLGNWQSGRAATKRDTAAAAPLSARGELLAAHTLFLQNRLHQGKPGFYVVQPLRFGEGRHVLVLRGWSAVAALPPTPRGAVVLEGVRRERLPRVLEATADGARDGGNVRQNISIAEFGAWSGLTLEPYVIEQRSALVVTQPPAAPDGLVRDWPRPEAGAGKHESYALQWYGLGALCLILLLALNLKIERRQS